MCVGVGVCVGGGAGGGGTGMHSWTTSTTPSTLEELGRAAAEVVAAGRLLRARFELGGATQALWLEVQEGAVGVCLGC